MSDAYYRTLLRSHIAIYTIVERDERAAAKHDYADAAKRFCEVLQQALDKLPPEVKT